MGRFAIRRFQRVFATSCAATARNIGLRKFRSKSDADYHNPFPELYAVAEAVKRLRKGGFLVMPEVMRDVVRTAASVKAGNPGNKAKLGRYDLVAWTQARKPAAILELKWMWNNAAHDVSSVRTASRQAGCHGFMAIMAIGEDHDAPGKRLQARLKALGTSKEWLFDPVYSDVVNCDSFSAGRPVKSWYFQAVVARVR